MSCDAGLMPTHWSGQTVLQGQQGPLLVQVLDVILQHPVTDCTGSAEQCKPAKPAAQPVKAVRCWHLATGLSIGSSLKAAAGQSFEVKAGMGLSKRNGTRFKQRQQFVMTSSRASATKLDQEAYCMLSFCCRTASLNC